MRNIIHKGFFFLAYHNAFDWLDDENYLKLVYWARTAKHLRLSEPKTFNEKLQWLKLHDRREEYTGMVDKYAVKDYVASLIGEEYIIPTLGAWDSFDEIDFDSLPKQFVLKCTHDSGGLVICSDKDKLDMGSAKKKINRSLKANYFKTSREWPYKNVPKKIIAEKYMTDESNEELKDYKLMCFNGRVEYTLVCSGRFSDEGLTETFYDRDWNTAPFYRPKHPPKKDGIKKPETYDEMVRLAEIIAKDIPFVRVDFYDVNGRVYFGEITFYPASGCEAFMPEEWEYKLGDLIDLPVKGSNG
ncbi:MAG: glycosyl transferase [Clostridia bacterium]|nr:glycosyl transferase [Clostridia bacterium]